MKYLLVLGILCTLIFGCNAEPISSKKSDNPEITYEYLFTIKEEGVKVYRFMDSGYKYIAIGDCGKAQAMFDVKHGKTEVPNTIQVIEKKDLTQK